jgi:hypothetical protein
VSKPIEFQRIYSRIWGPIEVEMMWDDNNVQVVKMVRGEPLKMAQAAGEAVTFLYWRFNPPERRATRDDLRKALGPLDALHEAFIRMDNQDIPYIEAVLEIRKRMLKSAGVVRK